MREPGENQKVQGPQVPGALIVTPPRVTGEVLADPVIDRARVDELLNHIIDQRKRGHILVDTLDLLLQATGAPSFDNLAKTWAEMKDEGYAFGMVITDRERFVSNPDNKEFPGWQQMRDSL
jgi:hypothetical protein